MYDRTIENTEHIFLSTGMLWNNNLVMADAKSRTEWSQILGRAMRGPMKDTLIARFPIVITNLKVWRETYPKSTVMSLMPFTFAYRANYINKRPSNFVIAMQLFDETPRAWRLDQLNYVAVLNDMYGGRPVLVTYDRQNSTSVIFNPTVNGQVLEFEEHEKGMLDLQTRSIWDPLTGIATEGKFKGMQLEKHDYIVSFYSSWRNMNLTSKYWVAPEDIVKQFEEQIADENAINNIEIEGPKPKESEATKPAPDQTESAPPIDGTI